MGQVIEDCAFVDVSELSACQLAYWAQRASASSVEAEKVVRYADFKKPLAFDAQSMEAMRSLVARKFGKYLPEKALWP